MLRLLPAASLIVGCSFSGGLPSDTQDAATPLDAGTADSPLPIDAAIDAALPVTLTFRNGGSYTETHDTNVDSQNPAAVFGDRDNVRWDFDAVDDAIIGLLRFGLIVGNDMGQIPPGTQLTSATLSGEVRNPSAGTPAEIRRVLIEWDEDTNFDDFSGDGTIDDTEIDNSGFIDAPTVTGPFTLDVTETVQGWIDDPTTNNGWSFFPRSSDQVEIYSSEDTVEARRPRLEVTFMP